MTKDISDRLEENIEDYERMNQTGTLLSDAKAEIDRLRGVIRYAQHCLEHDDANGALTSLGRARTTSASQ